MHETLNSERHVRASLRAESQLIASQSEFPNFLFLTKAKRQNDAQMTYLACGWQLELNRTNQEL